MAKAPTPTIKRHIKMEELQFPDNEEEVYKYMETLPNSMEDELFDKYEEAVGAQGAFMKQEGVAAVIVSDRRAHNGLVFAEAAGSFKTEKPMAPPTFVVTEEQYSRMQRLVEKKQPVKVSLELKAKFSDHDVYANDIIAEIPGQKKPDEVVMVGAHFDSWHTGTGATDNGAGSAVMLEVVRILKKLNLQMDRTVRIGLWSGEEQGLYGSRAYVKDHFADIKTGEVKPEQAKLDAYLNLDNGSGKIRGIYLEGNDAIRPLFEHWLAPFRDMGVTTVSLQHTGGTDHLSFDDAGLPAFQFIQDPLDYGSITHHSDMDTYPHAIQEDLMQCSAVIATLVYDIANREQMVPRKLTVQNGKLVTP
jgi:Iap family predicted aminopeptidase